MLRLQVQLENIQVYFNTNAFNPEVFLLIQLMP